MTYTEDTIRELFFQQLAKDLDKKPDNDTHEDEESSRMKISVTALTSECPRQIYYGLKLRKMPLADVYSSVYMWIGKKLHELTVLGDDAEAELRLEYMNIVGRVDEYKDGILLEKKTVRSTPKAPYIHHLRQVEYYTILLERNNKPVHRAFIMYINVSNSDIKIFDVTPMLRPLNLIEREMIEKAEMVAKMFSLNELPPRKMVTLPDSDTLICKFCPFFSLCIRDINPNESIIVSGEESEE